MSNSLSERYRPKSLDDLVGQEKIVKRIKLLREKGGLQGRVFWLVGRSGSGKTSCARIIAEEIADSYATFELDAMEYTMDFVREMERMTECKPIGRGCWVFICNEAHGLSDKVLSRLQTTVERPSFQKNATFILTTTNAGQQRIEDCRFDALPFLSRATVLQFESSSSTLELAYAVHVRKIAQAEGCDGKPLDEYLSLLKRCGWNLRRAIGEVESGAMLD